MRPVVIGLERIGIKMVRRIDAAAGIDVFIPGAADSIVLFQDNKRDAGLLQLNSCIEAGHAGADDDDLDAVQPVGAGPPAPFQAARLEAVGGQVLAHHRDIVVGNRFAGRDRHHLAQQRVVDLPMRYLSRARDFRQHLAHVRPDRCPKFLGHEFLVAHRPPDERLCRFQPMPQ